MYYETLLEKAHKQTIRVLLIGAGEYGQSFIYQSMRVTGLEVVAVCDRDVEKGVQTFLHAGLVEEDIVICESAAKAKQTMEAGKAVVAADALMLMELPFDVVIEATGSPEAAAQHAEAALRHGKHVTMVSKEADSVIGPLLSARARDLGLVYTPVDGDQPSLLMQLVIWARLIGLEVLCAGKSSEYDFVYHRSKGKVVSLDRVASAAGISEMWDLGNRKTSTVASNRSEILEAIPQHTVPDLIEMVIVANSIGFNPDIPEFHAPVSRLAEIADFLVPGEMGGILSGRGVVDVVNLLREPHEVSMAGGVFITVACEDKVTWEVLRAKGHILNRQSNAAMIYRPSHLLGVESATTVLLAAIEGQSSGPAKIEPKLDVVGRTTRALQAGTYLEAVGHHHQIDGVEGIMILSRAASGTNPIPYYLMANRILLRDIPAGTVITADMVKEPTDSLLWDLRTEMDSIFGIVGWSIELINSTLCFRLCFFIIPPWSIVEKLSDIRTHFQAFFSKQLLITVPLFWPDPDELYTIRQRVLSVKIFFSPY